MPTIHVMVALCDNKYQGIVPVPVRIGNGDDLRDNLYWGASFGVKSYFKRSREWKLISSQLNTKFAVLERLVFTHGKTGAILVADAYRGREIRRCTEDFVSAIAGNNPESISIRKSKIHIGGGSDMVIYVGHNGLMDFRLDHLPSNADGRSRKSAMLCCKSQKFFTSAIKQAGSDPLLWTKSLMAPEAYTVETAIQSFLLNENRTATIERAARAYAKYQKCSLRAARTVFTSGF